MSEICRLKEDKKNEAVSVLVSAFYDYPVMRYILRDAGTLYDTKLDSVLTFYTEARFAKGAPVLGVRENGSLVAVALIDESSLKPWASLPAALDRLKQIIGDDAYSRLELYEKITGAAEPVVPHYFLGMLAVRKEHQGRGFSRLLLNEVERLSACDPLSTGICLTTEDEANVRLYEHFGFQVISESEIEELHSWCMFLSTRQQ
jgi:GNAT superfamily N-acetyltransferase